MRSTGPLHLKNFEPRTHGVLASRLKNSVSQIAFVHEGRVLAEFGFNATSLASTNPTPPPLTRAYQPLRR
jgi:hypothetical protein